jgi:hypothetical protein
VSASDAPQPPPRQPFANTLGQPGAAAHAGRGGTSPAMGMTRTLPALLGAARGTRRGSLHGAAGRQRGRSAPGRSRGAGPQDGQQ